MGRVVGLPNGIGVMFLHIPPIIMTLGMSSMVEGGLLLYTNGGSGNDAPTGVVYMATHRLGPVPVVAVVWLGVLVVATVVLSATPFGRRLYATGLNRRVAEFSGVNVRWVTVSVYVISGVAAALAAWSLRVTSANRTWGWATRTFSPPWPRSPSAALRPGRHRQLRRDDGRGTRARPVGCDPADPRL